jgi:hypothetical protein
MGPSGGPITKDQTGVETYATIFTLAPSRSEADVIWAASDDGVVHITRDNGGSWQNVTPAGVPDFVKWTTIEDSPHRPGTAFVTGNRFLLDDFSPYVYRTTDYGRSWTRITNGIPADEISRSIREDIVRPGLLFLGTERGVWVSFDDGQSWQRLQRNLPTVQVADLAVEDHDLAIGTHGRGFYILDNIDVLRQIGRQGTQSRAVQLFQPAPAYRGVDAGVMIDYFLPRQAQKVTLEILDPQGRVIRTFTGTPADSAAPSGGRGNFFGPAQVENPPTKAGLNRFTWNMRYPGYTAFPEMILWAARNVGPVAVPGRYQARLTVDGRSQTQPFEIRLDPRIEGVTLADLQRRFDLAIQIRDKVSEANQAILLIRGIEQQIDSVQARSQNAQVTQATERLEERLNAVEEEIYQVRNRSNQDPLNFPIKLNNKIAALIGVVESAEAPPTEQTYVVFRELSEELDQQLAQLNQILEQELPQVNQVLRAQRLTEIQRRPLPEGRGGARLEDGEELEMKRW